MKAGEVTLLFPGGVSEVFHGEEDAYKLLWPDDVDFVRTAAKFNATVVTLAAVGAYESYNILATQEQILDSPLGKRAMENSKKVPNANPRRKDGKEEIFVPPINFPKAVPARHYFLAGKPFDLDELDHNDKEACSSCYSSIKADLQGNIDKLLKAREKDIYSLGGIDGLSRLAFETASGARAPTFHTEELL